MEGENEMTEKKYECPFCGKPVQCGGFHRIRETNVLVRWIIHVGCPNHVVRMEVETSPECTEEKVFDIARRRFCFPESLTAGKVLIGLADAERALLDVKLSRGACDLALRIVRAISETVERRRV